MTQAFGIVFLKSRRPYTRLMPRWKCQRQDVKFMNFIDELLGQLARLSIYETASVVWQKRQGLFPPHGQLMLEYHWGDGKILALQVILSLRLLQPTPYF